MSELITQSWQEKGREMDGTEGHNRITGNGVVWRTARQRGALVTVLPPAAMLGPP